MIRSVLYQELLCLYQIWSKLVYPVELRTRNTDVFFLRIAKTHCFNHMSLSFPLKQCKMYACIEKRDRQEKFPFIYQAFQKFPQNKVFYLDIENLANLDTKAFFVMW